MKVLVLFSGGLDSTCLLYKYVQEVGRDNVFALNISYGQKHICERDCARWQAANIWQTEGHYFEEDLSSVFKFNPNCSALIKGSTKEISHESYSEQLTHTDVVSAYVPYRNGLMLSYAAAVAYQLGCTVVAYAAHADDAIRRNNGEGAAAYPDCTPQFFEAQAKAIWEGTGNKVAVAAPFINCSKSKVVEAGIKAGMTQEIFDNTHSCYEGTPGGCGTCGTCIDRAEALHANGLTDHGR